MTWKKIEPEEFRLSGTPHVLKPFASFANTEAEGRRVHFVGDIILVASYITELNKNSPNYGKIVLHGSMPGPIFNLIAGNSSLSRNE